MALSKFVNYGATLCKLAGAQCDVDEYISHNFAYFQKRVFTQNNSWCLAPVSVKYGAR